MLEEKSGEKGVEKMTMEDQKKSGRGTGRGEGQMALLWYSCLGERPGRGGGGSGGG